MTTVTWHSSNPSDPDVYHYETGCGPGSQIPSENRVGGTGNYRKCLVCKAIEEKRAKG